MAKKRKSSFWGDLGNSFVKGDIYTKLSSVLMGTGYIARKQIIKGILVFLIEALFILTLILYGIPSLSKFDTLGDTEYEKIFDPLTMMETVNDYDNSFLILLNSMVIVFVIFVFILFWMKNMINIYRVQLRKEKGRPINTFKQDVHSLIEGKFHITLLALPTLGVVLMNILPILILIAIAFTNYDGQHLPPGTLFTWVGFENFKTFFANTSAAFSYAFGKVASWTFIWAFFATFTCFIGGILLAKLINADEVWFKKMWRTLFIITIAIPQFVTLLLVRNFFKDVGIFNTICQNIGLTGLLNKMGLISGDYIPFLTNPGWAKVMIILINIWVGIPYQMLIATGVLMNIPQGQVEAARLDGASNFQIFIHVIMPYFLVVQGPALITDFVRNINNFNVIYLLTQDVYFSHDPTMAQANAKEVDLLVTWLFRLTNDNSKYNIASVIGIVVFAVCVIFTLVSFSIMMRGNKEEDFR